MSAPPEPASGRFDGALHRFPVRVYYEDTDAGGVVYHSNYLRWFERARTEVLRLLGIVQSETDEGIYAVADLSIRYAAPARLDDAVTIETRALEIGAASVRMSQQALRGKQLLAEATIRIGFLGADGRPRRQPAEWRAKFDVFSTKDPA
jgi:acyl-CoA thioester hydrolase